MRDKFHSVQYSFIYYDDFYNAPHCDYSERLPNPAELMGSILGEHKKESERTIVSKRSAKNSPFLDEGPTTEYRPDSADCCAGKRHDKNTKNFALFLIFTLHPVQEHPAWTHGQVYYDLEKFPVLHFGSSVEFASILLHFMDLKQLVSQLVSQSVS